MNFTLSQVFLLGLGYLACLFASAWLAEKKLLPLKLLNHPLIYTLALGSYASAWAFYGSFALAKDQGFAFLAYYLGISLVFSLTPFLLLPLVKLTTSHQLSSVADLLAFRFRSKAVGVVTTLGLLAGSLPLLAMQIQAIGDVIHLLTNQSEPYKLALVFCLVIILFTILFGAKNLSLREKNSGLVFALAFESLVKLLAFLALGVASLLIVFNGFSGLEGWLAANPQSFDKLVVQQDAFVWSSLVLIFFASAFTMPHIFHLIFAESPSKKTLIQAGQYLPVYLLLLALPVPIVFWAYEALGSNLPVEYATLALGGNWSLLSLIFGLAAASGTIILLTLALAPMLVNHLILATYQPPANFDLYFWLVRVRRLIISLIIIAAYVVYLLISPHQILVNLGLLAFIACIQFLPASLASVFWQTANRKGFFAGLFVGFSFWLVGLIGLKTQFFAWQTAEITTNYWLQLGLAATLANCLTFILVSLITTSTPAEKLAAATCNLKGLAYLQTSSLKVKNLKEFTQQLSQALGKEIAEHQTNLAFKELGFEDKNLTSFQLTQLSNQLQANLSSLMGAAVAQSLIDRYLAEENLKLSNELNFAEDQLDSLSQNLTGMAKDLDQLRSQHRQTLMQLPLGICSLGYNQEIMLWNLAMERLTGLTYSQVIGKRLENLPQPWQSCLINFLAQPNATSSYRQPLSEASDNSVWLGLHQAKLEEAGAYIGKNILLVEDQSHLKQLENQLIHKERLASIGRLAAGVAHEIGNPITGISSLAQNLEYDAEEPEIVKQTAQQILQLTQRITSIVQSLINFAYAGKTTNSHFETTQVKQVLTEAINLINLSAKGRNRKITLDCPEDLYLQADPQRLAQVIVNLLANARDATQDQQQILCRAFSLANQLIIEIHDEGTGISEAAQGEVFEPFFTTKEAGKGTGLGLSLVYSIVQEHQGKITLASPSPIFNQGSCFSCTFPLEVEARLDNEEHLIS